MSHVYLLIFIPTLEICSYIPILQIRKLRGRRIK